MKRAVLVYGLCGGLLIAGLKYIEYRFLVVEHSLEIYGGPVAIVFATVGIWLGLTLTRKEEVVVVREVPVPAPTPFVRNVATVSQLGITPRESEILAPIARGGRWRPGRPPRPPRPPARPPPRSSSARPRSRRMPAASSTS